MILRHLSRIIVIFLLLATVVFAQVNINDEAKSFTTAAEGLATLLKAQEPLDPNTAVNWDEFLTSLTKAKQKYNDPSIQNRLDVLMITANTALGITPDDVKAEADKQVQDQAGQQTQEQTSKLGQEASQSTPMYVWIIAGFAIFFAISGGLFLARRKNKKDKKEGKVGSFFSKFAFWKKYHDRLWELMEEKRKILVDELQLLYNKESTHEEIVKVLTKIENVNRRILALLNFILKVAILKKVRLLNKAKDKESKEATEIKKKQIEAKQIELTKLLMHDINLKLKQEIDKAIEMEHTLKDIELTNLKKNITDEHGELLDFKAKIFKENEEINKHIQNEKR